MAHSRYNSLITVFMALAALLPLCSCEKDDDVIEKIITFDLPKLKANAYVLSYNDFNQPDDVVIATPDTMYIEANIDYLISVGADPSRNDVIVVWRAIDEVPFIRRIVDKKNTGTVLRLKTEDADLSDVFLEADIVLSTSLKLFSDNPLLPPYKRYTIDNICHPAVVITHTPGRPNKAMTAEQLMNENPNWNIITAGINIDTVYTVKNVQVKTDNASFMTNSGVEIVLTVYNGLLRRFECTSSGTSAIETETTYRCSSVADISINQKFPSAESYTLVFWAGAIPVPVGISTVSGLSFDMKSDKALDFTTSMIYNADYNIGSIYRTEWRTVKDISLRFDSDLSQVSYAEAPIASTCTDIYTTNRVSIYNDFFSGITTRYTLKSVWSPQDGKLNSVGEFGFGGEVTNSTCANSWNVPVWSTSFDVVNTGMWNTVFSLR